MLKTGFAIAGMIVLGASLSAKEKVAPAVLEIDINQPIEAHIEGVPARLQVITGLVDRLTLTTDFVAANGIKPAPIAGKANINFWGRKEIEGKNRPLDYTIQGRKKNARAFWFFDVPQPRFDGSIGPWAMPFDSVNIRLSASADDEKTFEFPYFGDLNNGSMSSYQETGFGTAVSFGVERTLDYPVASAATGAAIATAYGGTLSGNVWSEHIAFGVSRPVRLMTLQRPFVIGPFSFSKIAVRTRSTIDAAGNGEVISEAQSEEDLDPNEIIVEALSKKAKKPAFTFAIGRESLNQCSTILFDKVARRIVLRCRTA